MTNPMEFKQLYKPAYPMVSNNFTTEGMYRVPRDEAFGKRFIQTNSSKTKNLITADVDNDQAEWYIKDLLAEDAIPTPSFITYNPASNHAHLGWFIEGYAYTPQALSYFEDVTFGLRSLSGSDAGYNGFSFRNPTSPFQATEWTGVAPYTLKALKGFTEAHRAPKRAASKVTEWTGDVPAGFRHRALFDNTRRQAYQLRRYFAQGDYSEFEAALHTVASSTNASWSQQLQPGDVAATVRSVARWTWKNFSAEKFASIQSHRSRQRKDWETWETRRALVSVMIEAGFTIREVAENLSLSYEAAKKLIQRVKKENAK